jgi:hypothetical protein
VIAALAAAELIQVLADRAVKDTKPETGEAA